MSREVEVIQKLKFIYIAVSFIMKGGTELMIDVYVTLIVHTELSGYTIDKVPGQLKSAVLIKLEILGLDGHGKPLS